MSRTKMALIASLGLWLAAPAGPVEAKAKKATPKEMTFEGDITSVNVPAKVFTVKSTAKGNAGEMTFHVARPNSISIEGDLTNIDGSPTPLSSLQKGEHVTVTYDAGGKAPVAKHLHRHEKPTT
jgi:cell envelope opacity-associated protein A